jgi:hypothetical protein
MRGSSWSWTHSARRARATGSPAQAAPGSTLKLNTGKTAGVCCSIVMVASGGSPACATRARTSDSALLMSAEARKSRESSVAPRTVFERTRTRSGMVLTDFSMGRVTATVMPRTGCSPRSTMTAMRGKATRG